jgi:hypothetical protein
MLERSTVSYTERLTSPQRSAGDDFIKLAAMRILRNLPGYSADFNIRLKDIEVDCILTPDNSRLPVVFIEAKTAIRNDSVFKRASAHLKRAVAGWGKAALQVVLTTAIDQAIHGSIDSDTVYLLLYDTESNDFIAPFNEWGLIDSIRRTQDAL